MVAYRCRHSGLYYDESFVKNWASNPDASGLGTKPVSLVYDTDYNSKLVPNGAKTMHSASPCLAELDCVVITEEEFKAKRAIQPKEDPDFSQTRTILQNNQVKKNPNLKMFIN